MKFGEYLKANLVVEWENKYIDYSLLKKLLSYIQEHVQPKSTVKQDDTIQMQTIASDDDTVNNDNHVLKVFERQPTLESVKQGGHVNVNNRDTFDAVRRQYAIQQGLPKMPEKLESIVPKDMDGHGFEVEFFRLLQKEVTKVNQFSAEQQHNLCRQYNRLVGHCRNYVRLKREGQVPQQQIRRRKRMLRKSCKELHRALQLLDNYRVLNYTACMKIIKKHDKSSRFKARDEVVPLIAYSEFFTSDRTEVIMDHLQRLFVEVFAKGDRSKGLTDIKVQAKPISHFVSFRLGLFVGTSLMLLVVLLFISRTIPNINQNSYFFAVFPVFRFTGLIIFHLVLFSVDMFLWRVYRVNHKFIFEANPRNALRFTQLMEVSTFMLMIWFAVFDLYLFSWAQGSGTASAGYEDTGVFHLVLFIVFFTVLFWPAPGFYHASRRFILRGLWDVIATPFSIVNFRSFFLADQLNSHVRTLLDLVYSMCFYTTGDFMNNSFSCKQAVSDSQWVVAILPAWWRFGQCIRRYVDTQDANPHLLNAGKYGTSIGVTLLSITQSRDSSFRPVWIGFAVFGAMYAYTWDIVKDWGLLEGGIVKSVRKYGGLRERRVVSDARVYYFCAVLNFGLRVAWLLSISPDSLGIGFNQELLVLLIAALEVYRRNQWNFFRVENEHLNNCGSFRAVREVPAIIGGDDDENGEEDDDQNDGDIQDESMIQIALPDNGIAVNEEQQDVEEIFEEVHVT